MFKKMCVGRLGRAGLDTVIAIKSQSAKYPEGETQQLNISLVSGGDLLQTFLHNATNPTD
jgi:hypothetical protein